MVLTWLIVSFTQTGLHLKNTIGFCFKITNSIPGTRHFVLVWWAIFNAFYSKLISQSYSS